MLDQQPFIPFIESYTRIFGDQIKLDDRGNRFFERFYQLFLNSHEDVANAFKHTNMLKQQSMLKKSLLYSLNFMANSESYDVMHKVAISHNRKNYDIKPFLYDLWIDCLVNTVKEFDPNYSDDVELAWRLAFSQCITYMKFMYDR